MFSALGLMGLLQMRLKKSYLKKKYASMIKIPNLFLFSLAFMSRISSAMINGKMAFFPLISIIFVAFFFPVLSLKETSYILTLLKYSEFSPLQYH